MRPACIILFLLISFIEGIAENVKVPSYKDFAVTNIFKGKPAEVNLSSDPDAYMFRTQLRRQAADGPNFAGHYKIAIWGCGTSCQQFAIIDSQNGRVFFPPVLPYVTFVQWDGTNAGLQFRIDSNLLILHGSPKEEPKVGTFYYLWQTNVLRLIQADFKKITYDKPTI